MDHDHVWNSPSLTLWQVIKILSTSSFFFSIESENITDQLMYTKNERTFQFYKILNTSRHLPRWSNIQNRKVGWLETVHTARLIFFEAFGTWPLDVRQCCNFTDWVYHPTLFWWTNRFNILIRRQFKLSKIKNKVY